MTEAIKFTEEELNSIRQLQDGFNQKMFQFGKFYLQRMELDSAYKDLVEAEKRIQEEYVNLQKQELELLEKLTKKYGEGQLNIADGTFIPQNPTSQ
jgi:hypothetical protein